MPANAMPDSVTPADGTVAALLVPAGAPPRTVRIQPDLRTLQRLVAGYIEPVYRDGWHAYLNEEGKLAGLPPNRLATDLLFGDSGSDVVAGDIVVLGDGPGAGEADVPADLVARVLARDYDLTRAAPTEFIAALPALLGFRPADTLLLVTLHDGQFGGAATISLHDLTAEDLRHLVGRATYDNDDDAAIVIVVGGSAGAGALPHTRLVDDTRRMLAGSGLAVAHAAWTPTLTPGASWLDYATGTGGALPQAGARRASVLRIFSGALSLPRRAYLNALLAPSDTDPVARRLDQLDRTRHSASSPKPQPLTRYNRRRLLRDALGAASGNSPIDDQLVIAVATALTDPATLRLAVELSGVTGLSSPRRLWTTLTRQTPVSHRAAPAALLALTAYRHGDGLLARAAHGIALASDHRHPVTRAVADAITIGAAPHELRDIVGRSLVDRAGHGDLTTDLTADITTGGAG